MVMFLETTSFMVTLSPIVDVDRKDPNDDEAKSDTAFISNAW